MDNQLDSALDSFGAELQSLLAEQLKQRQPIVQRWTKDMYQYRNRYEDDVKTNKSKVFVGYTRSKTDSWVAQMTDMLFPSDDKNYGISPTAAASAWLCVETLTMQSIRTPTPSSRLRAAVLS